MRRNFTKEEENSICIISEILSKEGKSQSNICKMMGLSGWSTKFGYYSKYFTVMVDLLTEENKDIIISLFKEGKDDGYIGNMIGNETLQPIDIFLKKNGYRKIELPDAVVEALISSGYTLDVISEMYDRSKSVDFKIKEESTNNEMEYILLHLNIIQGDVAMTNILKREIVKFEQQFESVSALMVKTNKSLFILKTRSPINSLDDILQNKEWVTVNKDEFNSGVKSVDTITCMETHVTIDYGFYQNKYFIVDISEKF